MRNMLPGCRLMAGVGGMSRTGRGRERPRAEIAVVRVLEKRLGALPVVAEFGRRLRIAEIVDELCPVRPVAWITHGEVIEALVANRLTAPAPMLRVQDWAAAMAVEEAYGIAPELLNDDRIARALDAVAPQLDAITGGGGGGAGRRVRGGGFWWRRWRQRGPGRGCSPRGEGERVGGWTPPPREMPAGLPLPGAAPGCSKTAGGTCPPRESPPRRCTCAGSWSTPRQTP